MARCGRDVARMQQLWPARVDYHHQSEEPGNFLIDGPDLLEHLRVAASSLQHGFRLQATSFGQNQERWREREDNGKNVVELIMVCNRQFCVWKHRMY